MTDESELRRMILSFQFAVRGAIGVGCYLVLGDGSENVGIGFVCSINASKKNKRLVVV